MASVKQRVASYSKKFGISHRNITLLKDVSLEEAIEYVKKEFKIELSNEVREGSVPGLLDRKYIKIIGK